MTVFDGAESWPARIPDPLAVAAEEGGGDDLRAPMPGLVKRLAAAPGQPVARGDVLAVMLPKSAFAVPTDRRWSNSSHLPPISKLRLFSAGVLASVWLGLAGVNW